MESMAQKAIWGVGEIGSRLGRKRAAWTEHFADPDRDARRGVFCRYQPRSRNARFAHEGSRGKLACAVTMDGAEFGRGKTLHDGIQRAVRPQTEDTDQHPPK